MPRTVKSLTKRKRDYTSKVFKSALEKAKNDINNKNINIKKHVRFLKHVHLTHLYIQGLMTALT